MQAGLPSADISPEHEDCKTLDDCSEERSVSEEVAHQRIHGIIQAEVVQKVETWSTTKVVALCWYKVYRWCMIDGQ